MGLRTLGRPEPLRAHLWRAPAFQPESGQFDFDGVSAGLGQQLPEPAEGEAPFREARPFTGVA